MLTNAEAEKALKDHKDKVKVLSETDLLVLIAELLIEVNKYAK